MILNDDVIVYPGHGQGTSCGKDLSSETIGTLGDQKKTNYALREDMTKDEFNQILLKFLRDTEGEFILSTVGTKEVVLRGGPPSVDGG
mgnify:CR=1 FL=1